MCVFASDGTVVDRAEHPTNSKAHTTTCRESTRLLLRR